MWVMANWQACRSSSAVQLIITVLGTNRNRSTVWTPDLYEFAGVNRLTGVSTAELHRHCGISGWMPATKAQR
jgi:hypothetical protein